MLGPLAEERIQIFSSRASLTGALQPVPMLQRVNIRMLWSPKQLGTHSDTLIRV